MPSDIESVSISDEMRKSYLDYAMSVIVSRALPDVRDGLKPVHRRILHSMNEQGYEWNRPYRKSARVVGDVIGKYHPHGNDAVYFSLVRMAQEFSLRVPLIDGQGNFGSIDGDMPAAMRYTEVRMEKVTGALLEDIDKDTVDFKDNYDGSEREPTVLPARFPQPARQRRQRHRRRHGDQHPDPQSGRGDRRDAARDGQPEFATVDEIMKVMPGPDFPTAGIILGRTGIRQAYETGRGSILMRGRVGTEEIRGGREALIITEIPYQVNKAQMIEKMGELVREKRVEGISDIRDESDRHGMRVVIELKRDAVPDVVLNQLYRFTPLQSSFGCNFVALNGGKPELMNVPRDAHGLHRVPRAGGDPPRPLHAQQGARPRAYPGRPRGGGRQRRRGHQADPRRARSGGGARTADGARLAGQGRRAADRADRRSAPHDQRRRHLQAVATSRPAPSSR